MSLADTSHDTPENFNLRSAEAFQTFYTQSYLPVFRYIYGLHGGPSEEVEDLTAETFMRAWKSRRRFRGSQRSALGWMLKIARNLVIDAYRRQKNRGFEQDIEQHVIRADLVDLEEQTLLRDQLQVLWALLQTLPPQQREILVLRYLLNWRVYEIGEYLEIKENTVSVTIRRALNQLRQSWPGVNDDVKNPTSN